MNGVVVDLGGKRDYKRGRFRPPEDGVARWVHLNLDVETRPDICADIRHVPLRSNSADCVICTEVLEHLPDPKTCVDEARRVLRDGGVLIASVPFVFPIHGDPQDYWRFTPEGIRELCRDFSEVVVRKMGGAAGTIFMLVEQQLKLRKECCVRRGRLIRLMVGGLARAVYRLDMQLCGESVSENGTISTGYSLVARR
jgi:SAM-dependent methyltransferase